jgi:hypothetical protein
MYASASTVLSSVRGDFGLGRDFGDFGMVDKGDFGISLTEEANDLAKCN